MMKTHRFLFPLALGVLVLRCMTGTDDHASRATNTTEETPPSSLIGALRSAGLRVEDAGIVEQPFFNVPAHVYAVDGGDLQLYEFRTVEDAEAASRQISAEGTTVGGSSISWIAPPHWFRDGALIINYVGTSDAVLAELKRILGPPFAGR